MIRHSIILFFILWHCVSCKFEAQDSRAKPLIVATTSILADGIQNLVGDYAEVVALMPAGVDPHLYKASVRDLDLLTQADLVVYHGLFLEGKMSEIFEKLSHSQNLIDISKGLDPKDLIRSGPEAHSVDPHIWFDVKLWSRALNYASQEIILWKPEWKSGIESNSATYLHSLTQLDSMIRIRVNELRSAGQVLVTAHDAFAYFGKAYDMEVKSLQGLSTLSEPGLRDLTDLIQTVQEFKVKAIFAEQTISPKALKAVAAGAAEKNHQVTLAGPLYTDSLDAQGTEAGTYIGMVQTNLNIIYKSLMP
jgi:manganese/zinc/iron transport system substrate-binding protein